MVEGYHPVYGARPLRRVVQRRVENPISREGQPHYFAPQAMIRVPLCPSMHWYSRPLAQGRQASTPETAATPYFGPVPSPTRVRGRTLAFVTSKKLPAVACGLRHFDVISILAVVERRS